ncbi:unnamed protein product [Caenorhabditis brenneri]
MDFGDSDNEPNIDDFLNNHTFPASFESLELDSLLFDNDESEPSSSSSGFEFNEQNAGFRSRDGGSLGDSSSDSSPPLSCTNFTETDQEMWDFAFQNPSPFMNKIDAQYDVPFHDEEVIADDINNYIEPYVEDKPPAYFDEHNMNHLPTDEVVPIEEMPVQQKRVIRIVPSQTPIRRVISKPVQKFYRVKEYNQVPQKEISYRVIPSSNIRTQQTPPRQTKQPIFHNGQRAEIHRQPQSGPLIRKVEEPRYVSIAPLHEIKVEETLYTSEQNRKIRNRMYAQASRIRKKEYEEALKANLQEALHENKQLRSENKILKERLSYYEPERFTPPPRKMPTHRKVVAAGTALMMFGLFAVISPFGMSNQINATTQILAVPNETSIAPRHSRVLTYEETQKVIEKPQPTVQEYSNSTHNDCDMYKLNATETLRVNNDIDRWVQVHSFDNVPIKFSGGLLNKEAMKKFNEARKQKMATAFGPQKQVVPKKSEQAALRSRERTWRQLDLLKTQNDIQKDSEKIQKKRQDIDKIASIVRQNRDTLYIMTLQDYVLLPSLMKGSNSIPKLSLLLPSVPMNGTLLDQYTLLRVDCEVTGTGQLTLSNKQLSYLMP